jgi:hypothetical protein
MNEPKRSAALKRVLAAEADGLPRDFAAQVAVLVEVECVARARWAEAAMVGAFVALLGVCVAGSVMLVGPPPIDFGEFLTLVGRATGSQPWLLIGVAGLGIIQLSTFFRRVRS